MNTLDKGCKIHFAAIPMKVENIVDQFKDTTHTG
jgi:hypothetical protein